MPRPELCRAARWLFWLVGAGWLLGRHDRAGLPRFCLPQVVDVSTKWQMSLNAETTLAARLVWRRGAPAKLLPESRGWLDRQRGRSRIRCVAMARRRRHFWPVLAA